MASFEELVNNQKEIGERIETIIRNFKKDSATRKSSLEYFQERLRRLDGEWAEFESNDNKIRMMENIQLDHKYFADDYYNAIMKAVLQYKDIFESSMLKMPQSSAKPQGSLSQQNQTASADTDKLLKLIRRQAAIMASLERLLKTDLTIQDMPIATRLWQNIEDLHLQISEISDEPVTQGYKMQQFIKLENDIRKVLRSVNNYTTSQPTTGQLNSQSESIPMPKITLPKFDGNYLKWQEFYDLFSSLVGSQSIPKVQKIWYLKTHLVGEAANLIKHFTATGENFDAAWSTIIDRYHNKRLLVDKLIQELVDAPNKMSADNYKCLHDKTKECLLALQNLDIDTSTWDPLLIHLLLKRLDQVTRLRYEQSLAHPREVPTIKEFLNFLERNFQSAEAMSGREKFSNTRARVCTSITIERRNNELCSMCKYGKHLLFACPEFLKLSPSARLQFVQKQKYCVNCLRPGHNAKNCGLRSCMKCGNKHNTLLHLKDSDQNARSQQPMSRVTYHHPAETPKSTQLTQAAASLSAAKHTASNNYILLGTAIVLIRAGKREIQCRALLDSGSQINFVSERLVNRLGISTKPTSITISGIGSSNTKVNNRVNVELCSKFNNYTTRLEAAVLKQIISPQPSQIININHWNIPNNISLADPSFYRPDNIDILLGAEFHHQLLVDGQIKLAKNLPILQNTLLGWIIAGKIEENQSSTAACGMCIENETTLEEDIAQLWELEKVSSVEKTLSVSERQCENHFAQTYSIDTNGRFVVRIPFCDNPEALGESHGIAFNRFLSLERRLARAPEVRAQYIQFMKEYEQLGHMTQIDINSSCKPNYFIPHHSILRPDSLTTKLRVVFDASTKTSSGLALNDLMYTGPINQSELFSILLRFRLPRFVFTTDIEKMYRQMLIHPDDRRFQIIIWRHDPAMPIKYYQLNTITYGTRSAPYLATKCLERIAKDNMAQYPYGSQFLLKNFYVDDGMGGSDDLSVTLTIQQELTHILKKHGLNLQKWNANHPKLLQAIAEKEQEVNIDFSGTENQTVKILGLSWMPKADKFCVKVCLGEVKQVTKRTVTSDLARLFDPLGILAPIIITAKMFIQELWQTKLEWDEALPTTLHTRWMTFRTELEQLNNLEISRHVFEGHISSNTQIHAFADASEKAYGAVVYIRSIIKNGQVIVRLLCARSRVAPLKRQTLPRLELCAALLCAQLTARVKSDLNLKNTPTYLWTDSEIVLAWINSKSSSYQTFVANRISAIQELSIAEQWRHVKSKENPADIISRGLSPSNLAASTLWFYGPIFLHGREELWPTTMVNTLTIAANEHDMELKRVTTVAITDETSTDIIYKIQHNGSFRTLQRVMAYMLRFINRTRRINQHCEPHLTPQELEQALIVIIRGMQRSDFEADLKNLKKHGEVSRGSQYVNLTPFLDINGIIRVGGRLKSSILPYDAKHPMLIPYNDPITKLIMQMTHEKNRHCGPQALLSHVRQNYWPVKGKTAARSIVQHCIRCTRAKPQLLNQIMGNLPSTRVTQARPFINSGVDFCGPLWVHYKIRGKKPHKAYIAVFCCFATKAVHLELVTDLTTEAFIGALRRFMSRRGHCRELYCDNATNFVGTKNQLTELSDSIYSITAANEIHKECSSRGITFHFIPPRAPHFGGLWEAAVKSAKNLLLRSVATASLTYEELDTVVIEIEGILNSRPITPMSNNPNDLNALTPGHFLIGEPLNTQTNISSKQSKMSLLTRWKLVTHLKEEFWRRWSREYLCELQYRHKWKTRNVNVKPGDMVIVKEDNTSPLKWPLARIVKTYQGDDGLVRVADVRTASGICRRPIARLAPLPIDGTETGESSDHEDLDTDKINTSENAKKKRRISIPNSIITALIALILLPLVLGAKVHNMQFGNQLGIHFEGIGSAAISSSDWQMLIYYDLKEFWVESEMFAEGIRALSSLCNDMQEKSTCKNLVKYFEHTKNELNMSSTLLSGRRYKRGAIDLVGNIAHSLFGVLDSKYAQDMANTIAQVKENEAHLISLLRNQTSIIDSTMNILKSDQLQVKKKFDQIDLQISQIYNKIHNVSEELYQERIYRIFSSLCIQLTITASNLQQTQSSILDILTNTHHGIISPLILTPYQLQQEIEKIQMHLPESLELPVKQNDVLQLYKLMKVQGGLTNNTVVFCINLPLVERIQFTVFNLVPVPNWINDTLVSIKPCSSLLAVNIIHRQYFTIDNTELNACAVINEDNFVCSRVQIRYESGSPTCACEISLLHNETKADCPVQQIKNTTAWIPLHYQNKWIYALPTALHTTAVCKRDITQFTLQGSGLLYLEPECTLKHKFMSLQGRQTISSSLKTSYTRLWEITVQTHATRLKPLLEKIHTSEYNSQIQNLTDLQTSLKAQEIFQLPNRIDTHNYHHMAVGYSALIATFCILLYLISKKKCSKRLTPIPAPRQQQPTSEFTVHI